MAGCRTWLNLVVGLVLVTCMCGPAAAQLGETEKDLIVSGIAAAGGLLQQVVANRAVIRSTRIQANAQVQAQTAALAQAQAQAEARAQAAANQAQSFPQAQGLPQATGGVPFSPGRFVPTNQIPQQQLQAPTFIQPPVQVPTQQAFPQQPFPQQAFPQQPFPQQALPPQALPQQAFPQQAAPQVNLAGVGGAKAALPPVNLPPTGGSVVDACSPVDTSPQAVERCINAVRTNPNAFLGLFPCSIPGLSPRRALINDLALTNAAIAHVRDLAGMGTVGHIGSDGSDVRTRAQDRAGFPNSFVGENAAGGQTSAREVVFQWMCSPGHRDNLMSCNYDTFGTGVVQGSWPYFVQNFGCRSGSCTC